MKAAPCSPAMLKCPILGKMMSSSRVPKITPPVTEGEKKDICQKKRQTVKIVSRCTKPYMNSTCNPSECFPALPITVSNSLLNLKAPQAFNHIHPHMLRRSCSGKIGTYLLPQVPVQSSLGRQAFKSLLEAWKISSSQNYVWLFLTWAISFNIGAIRLRAWLELSTGVQVYILPLDRDWYVTDILQDCPNYYTTLGQKALTSPTVCGYEELLAPVLISREKKKTREVNSYMWKICVIQETRKTKHNLVSLHPVSERIWTARPTLDLLLPSLMWPCVFQAAQTLSCNTYHPNYPMVADYAILLGSWSSGLN